MKASLPIGANYWRAAIALTLALTLGSSVRAQPSLEREAIALRPLGPKGLQQFLNAHSKELAATLPPKPLRDALDRLCQQRDCYASRLYWFTDLDRAKAAAAISGKPILSLRLLGNLDRDLSCANSRFFRVALYPNAEISKVLRDRFILHWQSVRPVPKVTIDFGDGRKLERTLTGNSIHYILDASGRPVDAIPGLYGPQAFLRQLQQSEGVAKTIATQTDRDRNITLKNYYGDRLNAIQSQWSTDLAQLGLKVPARLALEMPSSDSGILPRADRAGTFAAAKMAVENPIVSSALNQRTLAQMTDRVTWEKLAQRYASDAKLDARSLDLIRAKQAAGAIAAPQTAAQSRSVPSIARSFESAMALDTVRNEYLLHAQLYRWFLQDPKTQNADALNDRVYAELFLTPKTDPWLGLLPGDSYSALDNDGISTR
ncbi:hypothetical protein [Altericista sp. CCNU0014]|uniref:hypothetical protein n=1 Tax=Altericista sp. CCNU0014 TaxID=3082949 RepID=UPI00384BD7D2